LALTALALFLLAASGPARAGGNNPNGGKPCPPAGNPTCGDPITIGSGNVFEEATDYQSAGPNKLMLTRYYNSPIPGTFNFFAMFYPWRTNYDSFVYIPAANEVDVILPDNKNFYFVQNLTTGAWIGPYDFNVKLTSNINLTSVALTDWNDTIWIYNQEEPFAGSNVLRLTSIQYRNGYTQNLQYTPCPYGCANAVLTAITDSYGRTLTFDVYHTQVTTADGLTIYYDRDSLGRVATVTYPTDTPSTVNYVYEDPSFEYGLTGIIDENGNRYSTIVYDDSSGATSGFALSRQNAGGANQTTVVYNSDGSRLVTNALGQQELYKFTSFNTGTSGSIPISTEIDRLATATTAAATRKFTYDGNGNYASQTDWNGNKTTYINDARGRPTTITEAVGTLQQRVTQITWHSSFTLPTQIVTPGLTTSFTYDVNGNLLTRSEVDTTTTTYPYSTNGQTRTWNYTWANSLLTSATDPRGHTTHFSWDASGALTSITNALGQVTQITQHTADGYPQTLVDPNGVVTNLAYDGRHRLISRTVNTSAGPLITSYEYDPAGNLTQITPPDGSALAYTYDAAHRLVSTADLFGQQIQYALDALGDRTHSNILNNASTVVARHSATFDALRRLLTDIGGVGQTTTYAYDANGNRTSITDPLGRVSHQTFDALNRRTTITDPANGVTGIVYDAISCRAETGAYRGLLPG
jgi:YD repeat-containing protein